MFFFFVLFCLFLLFFVRYFSILVPNLPTRKNTFLRDWAFESFSDLKRYVKLSGKLKIKCTFVGSAFSSKRVNLQGSTKAQTCNSDSKQSSSL